MKIDRSGGRGLGFSLLELLVVMAVVVVLASLLLVAISKARGKARLAACQNNFRQLVTAWHLYAEDYQGRLVNNVHLDQTNSWVRGSVSKFGEGGVTNTQFLVGEEALFAPYVSTYKTYHCPADGSVEEIGGMVYRRVRSVSMNAAMGYESEAVWLPGAGYEMLAGQRAFETYRSMGDVREPSGRYVFVDESDRTINDCAFGLVMPQLVMVREMWVDAPSDRHGGVGVLAYGDGHVEGHRWLDEWTGRAYFRSSATGNVDWRWLASKTSALLER